MMMHNIPASLIGGSKRSTQLGTTAEAPEWAKELIDGMMNMRVRLDNLAPKIERSLRSSRGGSYVTEGRSYQHEQGGYGESEVQGDYTRSPLTQTTHILGQQTGTMGDESMYPIKLDEQRRDDHAHAPQRVRHDVQEHAAHIMAVAVLVSVPIRLPWRERGRLAMLEE